MRFLGITETCDLGALYLRLKAEGHAVRISVSEPLAQGTLAGLIERTADWRGELEWIREAGAEGIILFESVSEGFGQLQDELRGQGFNVIGGSAYGDRLENDRAYAQALLAELGFPAGHVWEFDDAARARDFIAARPARYVLKFSGPGFSSSDNYIGQLPDGSDVRALLAARFEGDDAGEPGHFILMEHLSGVEMGIGAYFNGERFLLPACLDWEHKRFFAGDMGELTGEMGTVATFSRSRHFYDLTLGRIAPLLAGKGHVGYVNLNTIANEAGIWPLEFTCRFGYPGYAILDPLQAISWADLLKTMVDRSTTVVPTHTGFSVGLVLTTPPFPYSRKEIDEPIGLPIILDPAFSPEDHRQIHFGEVGMAGEQLVTSGLYGWTMVVTGTAATIAETRGDAYARAKRIVIPNVRYRLDIGDRLIAGDYAALESWGMLDPL